VQAIAARDAELAAHATQVHLHQALRNIQKMANLHPLAGPTGPAPKGTL
jgi:DNA-binding GntR family transcriptional regulator